MKIAFVLIFMLAMAISAEAATIDTVQIGNPGNLHDPISFGYGSVAYSFRIGTFETTNSQYTDFLNAVAATDTFALYNTNMATSTWGGIARSGSSGTYTYSTKLGFANKPVTYVSWYDAIRFTNWLHNGQLGPGSTEYGAYTLGQLEAGGVPINGLGITRNPDAKWWLPSKDEWYKAAYYNPVTASYFDYPTRSNVAPTASSPPGGTNSANINSVVGTVTDVGAYANSQSPYQTFDQAGNVWEWSELVISSTFRGIEGGAWNSCCSTQMEAGRRFNTLPTIEDGVYGFRVASAYVPEPPTILLAIASIPLLSMRDRKSAQNIRCQRAPRAIGRCSVRPV